jgi:hypothetical protein
MNDHTIVHACDHDLRLVTYNIEATILPDHIIITLPVAVKPASFIFPISMQPPKTPHSPLQYTLELVASWAGEGKACLKGGLSVASA